MVELIREANEEFEEEYMDCVDCPWGNGEGGCTVPHCPYHHYDYDDYE